MGSRRWYAQSPGRWTPQIEAALASKDPRRRRLAWLILETVGGGRGCQSRFAELVGVGQGQVSNWLSGAREMRNDQVEKVAQRLGRDLHEMFLPDHPFAIRRGKAEPWEPGDPEWLVWWRVHALHEPDVFLPPADLLRRFPDLFPEGFEDVIGF